MEDKETVKLTLTMEWDTEYNAWLATDAEGSIIRGVGDEWFEALLNYAENMKAFYSEM